MFFGPCMSCGKNGDGDVDEDGDLYCHDCWEFYNACLYRCFTVSAVYDAEGNRLAIATSIAGCAERSALWKLRDEQVGLRKTLVVARIRKNGNRATFGDSKPCVHCLAALRHYNVGRVAYSENDRPAKSIEDCTASFRWENTDDIKATKRSKSDVIVGCCSGDERRREVHRICQSKLTPQLRKGEI